MAIFAPGLGLFRLVKTNRCTPRRYIFSCFFYFFFVGQFRGENHWVHTHLGGTFWRIFRRFGLFSTLGLGQFRVVTKCWTTARRRSDGQGGHWQGRGGREEDGRGERRFRGVPTEQELLFPPLLIGLELYF